MAAVRHPAWDAFFTEPRVRLRNPSEEVAEALMLRRLRDRISLLQEGRPERSARVWRRLAHRLQAIRSDIVAQVVQHVGECRHRKIFTKADEQRSPKRVRGAGPRHPDCHYSYSELSDRDVKCA